MSDHPRKSTRHVWNWQFSPQKRLSKKTRGTVGTKIESIASQKRKGSVGLMKKGAETKTFQEEILGQTDHVPRQKSDSARQNDCQKVFQDD